jgi:hypothetical protein
LRQRLNSFVETDNDYQKSYRSANRNHNIAVITSSVKLIIPISFDEDKEFNENLTIDALIKLSGFDNNESFVNYTKEKQQNPSNNNNI